MQFRAVGRCTLLLPLRDSGEPACCTGSCLHTCLSELLAQPASLPQGSGDRVAAVSARAAGTERRGPGA